MRRDVYVIFALCRYIAGREMQDASPMLGRGGGRAAGSGLGFVWHRHPRVWTMRKGSCCCCSIASAEITHALQPVVPVPPSLWSSKSRPSRQKTNFKVSNIQCLAPRSQTYICRYRKPTTSESRPDRFPSIHPPTSKVTEEFKAPFPHRYQTSCMNDSYHTFHHAQRCIPYLTFPLFRLIAIDKG